MSRTDAIKTTSDHYCMNCYEVIPFDEIEDHREEVHDGSFIADIVRIHKETDDYIAQSDDMGHFTPHMWMDVDEHDMCGECGAVVIEEDDVPESLVEDRTEVEA